MAFTVAALLFVIISILLAALMAGKTGAKDAENTSKSSETNQSGGGVTTSEQGSGAATSMAHDHMLTTVRPRPSSSSVSPARRGGSHARVQDSILLNASPNSSSTPHAASGSAVGSVNSPLESSGGGGSLLNRVAGDQGGTGSPQGRKRGRDLDLNTVPPVQHGSPKAAGAIPPPPPPPPQQKKLAPVDLPFPCSLCSRGFETPKGLCGHMRAHPDRGWRGAHPPPVFSRQEFNSVHAASIVVESSAGSVAALDVMTKTSTNQDKEASGVGVGHEGRGSSMEEKAMVVAPVTGDQEKQGKLLPFDLNASPPKEEEEEDKKEG